MIDNCEEEDHRWNKQGDEAAIGGNVGMVCVINGQRQSDTVRQSVTSAILHIVEKNPEAPSHRPCTDDTHVYRN